MTHLVVLARPLWQLLLIRFSAVALVILTAWGVYELGRYQGGYRLLESRENIRALEEQVTGLNADNLQLREQSAMLARGARIDREAYKQLEGTVNGLQDELMELKRELDFYRGIVSPSDASRGLEIQRFVLTPQDSGRYQYTLVLTQVLDNSNVVQGTVEVNIEGSENGETKEYTLAQLSEADGDLAFRYRYFQSFEGELALPEGFEPKRTNLNIKPRGRTYRPFSQSFDWVVGEN